MDNNYREVRELILNISTQAERVTELEKQIKTLQALLATEKNALTALKISLVSLLPDTSVIYTAPGASHAVWKTAINGVVTGGLLPMREV